MEGVGNILANKFDSAKISAKGVLLAVVIAIFTSGAPYLLSLFHRSLTWILWITMIWVIYRFSKELSLPRLLRPILPYLLWLVFYLTWALIVSPITDFAYAGRVAVITTIFATALAFLLARPQHLRVIANLAQLVVVANLALWFLMNWSPKVASLVMEANDPRFPLPFDPADRYAAMFGNPNSLGYVCLVAVILSVLAAPWIGWMGRLASLPLLYLTASRRAPILGLLILILYVVIVQRRNVKFWVMSVTVALAAVSVILLSDGFKETTRSVASDSNISRLLDVQEIQAEEAGGETRIDLLNRWISALDRVPWYGYGLRSMAGTVYESGKYGKVVVKGPYPVGTHNTYLGVWVETGPVGFIALILMLLHYARAALSATVDPVSKWVLISFLLVNYTFLFISHDRLFCLEGMISFTLFFLLPFSPGLQQMGRWRDGLT